MKSQRIAALDRKIGQVHRGVVFVFGLVMLGLSLPETVYAFASAEWAIGELCGHMQGNLGALLMSAAGLGAVISAALGNFRASYSFIIVGIGAFSVSAMMSLYFEEASKICEQGAQNGGGQTNAAPAAPPAPPPGGDPFDQD